MAVPEVIEAGVVTLRVMVPLVPRADVLVESPVTVDWTPLVVTSPVGVVHVPEAVVQYRNSTVAMVPVTAVVKAKVSDTPVIPARESVIVTFEEVREPA